MTQGVPRAIGDYEIFEEIGHGGMGTLYRARDPRIGRDVAIKLLREGLDDDEMRERFVREARSAGRLKHGNIVTIFELGEHEGMPFIAMEYVQGQTVAALLKQKPTLLLMRKLQMMDQVCAGLHYAHRMGIVHRDIKPANLMIDDEGTMKILDFGIARMGASKITHTGVVIGTLNYMSPEQMKGQPTDPRSDIFSIGAVFYELLSFRSPFAGDAPSTVMHKVLYGHPDQLEVICPNLDPSLVAIVSRCLEKQPANRYPDLGAVRNALGGAMRLLQASAAETEIEATRPVSATLPIEPPRKDPGRTPSSDRKDGANMDRMRARAEQSRTRQLMAHLENAQRAFDQGSYDLVFAACEQALVLDPVNAQALEIEARARGEVERQAQTRIAEARAEVDRGALTAASILVDQVLALSPDSSDAHAVRQSIEEARVRLAIEQERARERGRVLAQTCADAERWLGNGSFDAASEAVQRVLELDPTHQPALDVKAKIAKAVADREAARKTEEEARARKAIEEARRLFGNGDRIGAFSLLEGLARSHPAAASALDALKLESKEIERKRAEADRARLEEEATRLKRETDAARQKLEAELERVKREREETQKRYEAEAAQLKREREAERQRVEAERKGAEEERQKAEAERVRLSREADAARAAREEAARARDAQAARAAREAEAARLAKEREREAVSRTEETLYDPRGANAKPDLGALKPPVAPRPLQPPPLASRPVYRPDVTGTPTPGTVRSDLPKFVALGLMGVAAFAISAVLVVRNWGSTGQTVAQTPPTQAAQPPVIPPSPAPSPPEPPSNAQLSQQRLAQARQQLEQGNYDAAIQQAEQLLALDAGNADAASLRARALELKAAAQVPTPPAATPLPPTPKPAGPPAAVPPPPVATAPAATNPVNDNAAQRARDLTDRYTRAKNALDGGQFANAISLFEALQRDEPNYRDVPSELTRARTGLTAAARQALDTGAAREKAGDLPAALQQFERARQVDPSQASTTDAAIARVRTRMKNEGTAAFTNARQYDALDRIDQAISAYEIAVRYLTDDDPNRQTARQRLTALRARQ